MGESFGWRALLSPVDPQLFFRRHWQRQVCHIVGRPGKFNPLFDAARFEAVLNLRDPSQLGACHIGYFEQSDLVPGLTITEAIEPRHWRKVLAAGKTLCLTKIGAADTALQQAAEQLLIEAAIAGSVVVNGYLSPPGSGADAHLDARMTLSLQLRGHKTWWFARWPAVAAPQSNAQLIDGGQPYWVLPWAGHQNWEQLRPPPDADWQSVTLAPGDLLYLPAGTWHAARACERSTAINLAFRQTSFAELLVPVLAAHFAPRAAWRTGIPPSWQDSGPDQALGAHAANGAANPPPDISSAAGQGMPATLVPPAAPSLATERYLRTQLQVAARQLSRLADSPPRTLHRLWQRMTDQS